MELLVGNSGNLKGNIDTNYYGFESDNFRYLLLDLAERSNDTTITVKGEQIKVIDNRNLFCLHRTGKLYQFNIRGRVTTVEEHMQAFEREGGSGSKYYAFPDFAEAVEWLICGDSKVDSILEHILNNKK